MGQRVNSHFVIISRREVLLDLFLNSMCKSNLKYQEGSCKNAIVNLRPTFLLTYTHFYKDFKEKKAAGKCILIQCRINASCFLKQRWEGMFAETRTPIDLSEPFFLKKIPRMWNNTPNADF